MDGILLLMPPETKHHSPGLLVHRQSLLTVLSCLDSSHDLTAADRTEAAWAR